MLTTLKLCGDTRTCGANAKKASGVQMYESITWKHTSTMPFDLNSPFLEVSPGEIPIYRPIDIYIGKRLARRREELGFCCQSLARKTMLAEATIRSFEDGSTRIGSRDLLNISEALDTSISFFYSE